jgi:hypothetical protein
MTRFSSSSFPRCSSLLLGAFLFVGGCSGVSPTTPRPPESAEKTVFSAVSSFYCSEQRWPKTWDELIHYEGLSTEAHHAVGEMLTPELSSPRALLLVVRYKNMQGIDRKVTYIAPPECDATKDSKRVSMVGGRVTFKKIKGFVPLKAADIKAKWKDGPYPDAAWRDETGAILITVSFGEVPVGPSDLEALKEELEAAYESSVPGLSWIEKSLAGEEEPPKLIHILSSDTPAGRNLSYSMSLSFDGRLLTLSVSGPASRQKEVEAVGNSLRHSLRLR